MKTLAQRLYAPVEVAFTALTGPTGRDERKRGSSLPGADLVGFHRDDQIDRFAFGEVKTSTEQAYPALISKAFRSCRSDKSISSRRR